MNMNSLKRATPNAKHTQVGRGGKRGKTAGRGTKGQKARSGHRMRPELRDIIKKIPKKRGHGKNRAKSAFDRVRPIAINLMAIDKVFASGETVSAATLVAKGLITNARIAKSGVKILGTGEITKKLSFEKVMVSASAQDKIVAAGGSVA